MLTLLDKVKIRLAVSVGWSLKGKLPDAIRGFQATEADGVWHLHRGLQRTSDPRHRAILFSHSLEEECHAEEFTRAFHHYSDRVMTPATYERKDLYETKEPLWKTFAYVHVGEKDATDRFRYIFGALRGGMLKDSLDKIVTDEDGHVDLTNRMLVEMGATNGQIRSQVLKVRLSRLWDQWLRTGKRVVDTLATLLLSITYYLLGPFLYAAARKKLAHRFVEFDNNKLKRL